MHLRYLPRLKDDADRWVEEGLIDRQTADAIVSEADSHGGGVSFAHIVLVLGAICLCFAAMTFVAANWQEIPRIARLSLLLVTIWAAYAAAVTAGWRDHRIVADAFVLLGCGVFGAAIMLIGQMYHMPGNAEGAVLVWALGTLAAAALLRSRMALGLAIILFTTWHILSVQPAMGGMPWDNDYRYLPAWAACAVLAWWLASRLAAHLLVIGIILWSLVTAGVLSDLPVTYAWFVLVYTAAFLIMGLSLISDIHRGPLKGFEKPLVAYMVVTLSLMSAIWIVLGQLDARLSRGLSVLEVSELAPAIIVCAIAGVIALLAQLRGFAARYDLWFCAFWPAVAIILVTGTLQQIPFSTELAALCLSVWFIRMGRRHEIAGVSGIGYADFLLVLIAIYFRTAGSLLGSAGFYFVTGVLLLGGALLIPYLMRRKANGNAIAGELS